MENKRLACIDTLRFFAILGIIIIHTHYFFGWSDKDTTGFVKISAWFLDKACSFATPLFFIISGYFFGKSFLKEKNITKVYLRHIQRLLIVFLGWSFIYLFFSFNPFSADQAHIIKQYGLAHAYYWYIQDNYLKNPVLLLMIGTAGHLWFLSALMQALTCILFFVSSNKEKFLIYFALLVYILTPMARSYIHPPPGPYSYYWNPMIGLFLSAPPVVMGWWLSQQKECSYSIAFFLLVIGIVLVGGEFAKSFYGLKLGYAWLDTLLIPLSLVMIALRNPEWGTNTVLPSLGRMTLGIYCVHPLVMHYLEIFNGSKNNCLEDILLLALTYLISLGIILILRAYPLTRQLVV